MLLPHESANLRRRRPQLARNDIVGGSMRHVDKLKLFVPTLLALAILLHVLHFDTEFLPHSAASHNAEGASHHHHRHVLCGASAAEEFRGSPCCGDA